MLKKILIGSCFAFTLFLAIIFLFGDQHLISLEAPRFTQEQGLQDEAAESEAPQNITDSISGAVADQIIKDNPEGPQPGSDGSLTAQILDQKKLMADALSAEIGSFVPEDLIEPVAEGNITILPSNNPEEATAYFRNLLKIVNGTLTTAVSKTDGDRAAMFSQLSRERTSALKQLYGLKPTPDLAEIHRDLLTAVGTQRNIYDALASYETDPMKALMAAKFASDVQANLTDVTERMTDYVAEHQLKI